MLALCKIPVSLSVRNVLFCFSERTGNCLLYKLIVVHVVTVSKTWWNYILLIFAKVHYHAWIRQTSEEWLDCTQRFKCCCFAHVAGKASKYLSRCSIESYYIRKSSSAICLKSQRKKKTLFRVICSLSTMYETLSFVAATYRDFHRRDLQSLTDVVRCTRLGLPAGPCRKFL